MLKRKKKEKKPRYFCENCGNFFCTGKFDKNDHEMYDDVCPYCGAIGLTFEELGNEYRELNKEFNEIYLELKELKSKKIGL